MYYLPSNQATLLYLPTWVPLPSLALVAMVTMAACAQWACLPNQTLKATGSHGSSRSVCSSQTHTAYVVVKSHKEEKAALCFFLLLVVQSQRLSHDHISNMHLSH